MTPKKCANGHDFRKTGSIRTPDGKTAVQYTCANGCGATYTEPA